jgi:hypothetical protein
MRVTVFLLVLVAAASSSVAGQSPRMNHVGAVVAVAPCRGADLAVRQVDDDQAMGGVHLATYAFKNTSSTSCTLMGYPRFELLGKSGAVWPGGRAVNSQKLISDETKQPPQLVTIEPGKEVTFRIYFNSGGAGYMGKPCSISHKERITAPGTTRRFVLKDEIQSCIRVSVSAVRSEAPE